MRDEAISAVLRAVDIGVRAPANRQRNIGTVEGYGYFIEVWLQVEAIWTFVRANDIAVNGVHRPVGDDAIGKAIEGMGLGDKRSERYDNRRQQDSGCLGLLLFFHVRGCWFLYLCGVLTCYLLRRTFPPWPSHW